MHHRHDQYPRLLLKFRTFSSSSSASSSAVVVVVCGVAAIGTRAQSSRSWIRDELRFPRGEEGAATKFGKGGEIPRELNFSASRLGMPEEFHVRV